jgi:hypothetical protein
VHCGQIFEKGEIIIQQISVGHEKLLWVPTRAADHNAHWANMMFIVLGDGPLASLHKQKRQRMPCAPCRGAKVGIARKGASTSDSQGGRWRVKHQSAERAHTTSARRQRAASAAMSQSFRARRQGPTTTCRTTARKHMLRAVAGCSERQRCYSVVPWLRGGAGLPVLLPRVAPQTRHRGKR